MGIYAALGDSISTGYGLIDYVREPQPFAPGSFVNILARKLGHRAVNLAIDGLTSSGLNNKLGEIKAQKQSEEYLDLSSAELITVTIGGNDLLMAMFSVLADIYGIDKSDPELGDKTFQLLCETVRIDFMGSDVREGFGRLAEKSVSMGDMFGENIKTIVSMLHEMNPHTTIVFQTIANPYKDIKGFPEKVAVPIRAFNDIISKTQALVI